jgi:hypothetical protein
MTHKAGRTTPGTPYIMRYTDGFGNLCTRDVERPDVVSSFFQDSNVIDSHNQSRQGYLDTNSLRMLKGYLKGDRGFFRQYHKIAIL